MSWQNDDVVHAAPNSDSAPSVLPRASAAWEADEVVTAAPLAKKTAQGAVQSAQPQRSLGEQVGRQIGLTARHGLEGLGQAAEVVSEPIRKLITDPLGRAFGVKSDSVSTGKLAERFADNIGLPKAETSQERVVGDAARFMAGGAGIAGASGKIGQAVAPVTQQAFGTAVAQGSKGTLQAAAETMAMNPGAQIAGSAGAGAASGVTRESGGDGLAQGVAGLAGGLAGGIAGGMLARASKPVGAAQSVDQRIEQGLGRAGVDVNELPESIQRSLRAEAQQAARGGAALDGDALARLAEFQRVGATPTRGTLSLDPVQITREQNLARMGANSLDSGLHGLAKIQNENNRALIEGVNRLGAGAQTDTYGAGERMIGALQRGLDAEKAGVNALYGQARDSAGRSAALDGKAFTTQASRMLDEGLLGGALPQSVEQHLNRIAKGEVPFNVDYAEQLKTAIGKLQRAASDGQTRMALGTVRQALDDTPLMPGSELGEQAVSAFNRARVANREMMQRIESIPGLKAVYDGTAAPDDFVMKHVISSGAKALHTGRLANTLKTSDPETFEAVRAGIAQHLKQAAIGSASDETGRFSASGYNRAMMKLGRVKLEQFFDKDEVAQLMAVGKVAQYTTAQPAGSAVNNSNSGAMLLGRGVDLLDRLAAKVPLLGIGPTVSVATRGIQQRQAQQIGKALVRKPEPQPRKLPNMTYGTLMSSTQERR